MARPLLFQATGSNDELEVTDPSPPIAHEILAYLSENPGAQDTVEGIAEWWLLERCIRQRLDEVQKALAQLVDVGFVTERMGADSRVRFQLNSDKLPEIQALLHDE